ncbi:MAG: NADH-quinone oxidoreductase subunit C [Acidimicrobiales bacterium]
MTRLSSVAEPSPADAGDDRREAMVETLRQSLVDGVIGSEIAGGDVCVRVRRPAWKRTAEVCKAELGMDYFCFLAGLDWLENKDLSGEKVWDPDGGLAIDEGDEGEGGRAAVAPGPDRVTGVGGGDTRFQVLARLYSVTSKTGITLKADLDEADPRIESWVEVYKGADWHEREAWEMYGFGFDGHPGLRHMYLPGEFEGYPMRKDFPLLAREVKPWPGLVDVEAMPGEDEAATEAATDASTQESDA